MNRTLFKLASHTLSRYFYPTSIPKSKNRSKSILTHSSSQFDIYMPNIQFYHIPKIGRQREDNAHLKRDIFFGGRNGK